MRELTAKQKKALREAVMKYTKKNGNPPFEASDLPEFDDIEEMNPTEIFWQNANRFVDDLYFEAMASADQSLHHL